MAPAAPNLPRYHCACASSSTSLQPSATHPSTTHSLHSLDSLYFCDDCDAIRCERCVQVEITSYYCPNCLFEVPNASVRAERNRYAAIDINSHNASKLTRLTESFLKMRTKLFPMSRLLIGPPRCRFRPTRDIPPTDFYPS